MQPRIDVLGVVPAAMGEGPIWTSGEEAFFWLDIVASRLHRLSLRTMQHRSFELPGSVGCMALMEDGGLALALSKGLHRFDPTDLTLRLLVACEAEEEGRRSNDGAVDRQGRFWFSTVAVDAWDQEPTGRLWRCDSNGAPRLMLEKIYMPNGIAAGPDGTTLYLSDSYPEVRRIWSFDLDPDRGTLSNRRLFFDTQGRPGRPDGAAVDEVGCYWMAGVGGGELLRLTPDGRVDRVIELPVAYPTKPCFGGADLDLLLVTSIDPSTLGIKAAETEPQGGSTMILRPGVCGLPAEPFARRLPLVSAC